MEHQLQEFIELRVRSDIRVQDVCDRAFLTIACHRVFLSYGFHFCLPGTHFGGFVAHAAIARFSSVLPDDAINDVIEFPRTVGDFSIRDVRDGNSP